LALGELLNLAADEARAALELFQYPPNMDLRPDSVESPHLLKFAVLAPGG